MTRVLDIDLDFFVHGSVSGVDPEGPRLDPREYPPWSLDDTLDFLYHRCLLSGPLPGVVVERHGELFERWRDAISNAGLALPLSVTHIDAHADIGQGDNAYTYVLSDLLRQPVAERADTAVRSGRIGDGNYLLFAIASQWVGDLTYVYNSRGPGRPTDLLNCILKDFDFDARHVQLACMDRDQVEHTLWPGPPRPVVHFLEPEVPFEHLPWPSYQAQEPFDHICLARSRAFTPRQSDKLFDEIRRRFIDETLA